jgi:hypothetical protein
LQANEIGMGATPPSVQGGPAALRVADLRRSRQAQDVNLVRIDGTAAGSLKVSDDADPSDYRSIPAGTYVVLTNRPDAGDPVIRQVVTLRPATSYTLALFSAAESDQVVVQLAPDGSTGTPPDSTVRMLHAASATGAVYLAVIAPGMLEPMTLANQAGYGLITGYAALRAGRYDAVISANGREWRQPVEFREGEPTSLLLTDGPDGPMVRILRDLPQAPAALDPTTLTMPTNANVVDKSTAKATTALASNGSRIAAVVCLAAILGAAALMVKARRTRPSVERHIAPPPARGREVIRRAAPVIRRAPPVARRAPPVARRAPPVVRRPPPVADTERLDLEAKTARLRRVILEARPRRSARPADDTVRLRRVADDTAPLPTQPFRQVVWRDPT